MLSLLKSFAVDYTYDYNTLTTEEAAAASSTILLLSLILFVTAVVVICAMWKVFTKAGHPGWKALIPFYNTYIILKIVGRPGWWLVLYFIPLVNLIIAIMVLYELVKAFGKGLGMALLVILLPIIGWPMLAWGSAKYTKPPARA